MRGTEVLQPHAAITEIDDRRIIDEPVGRDDLDRVEIVGPFGPLRAPPRFRLVRPEQQLVVHDPMTPDLDVGRGRTLDRGVAEAVIEVPMRVDDPPNRTRSEHAQLVEQLLGLAVVAAGVDEQQPIRSLHQADVEVEAVVAPAVAAVADFLPGHAVIVRSVAIPEKYD